MLPPGYLEWMRQLAANTQEKKYEYLIGRYRNSIQYFYYDMDYIGGRVENIYQLIWTPAQRRAFPFESEQQVEEFKAHFITPRKASIIRVIKSPLDMLELMG